MDFQPLWTKLCICDGKNETILPWNALPLVVHEKKNRKSQASMYFIDKYINIFIINILKN